MLQHDWYPSDLLLQLSKHIAVLILPLSTKTKYIYSLEKDFLTSGLTFHNETQKLIELHFKLPYILLGAQLLPL